MQTEPTAPVFRLGDCAEALVALIIFLGCLLAGPVRAEAMLDRAMATVFTVESADAGGHFLGSAFLWGDGSVAVTAAHVVGKADQVRLTDAAGRSQIATVIARDARRDVAVIAVAAGGGAGLIPASAAPELGAEVWALGAPLGLGFTVTEGRVSATARQVDPAAPIALIQHDAAINPGSSGGPLIDAKGALLGMNTRIADGSRMFVGIAYAIPAADLSHIVAGLIDETLPPLPDLGLAARAVGPAVASALGIAPAGLLVDAVTAAGLADRAGLRAGDVILALNGQALSQPGDLAYGIEAATDTLDFTVLRDGRVVVLLASVAPPAETLTTRDLGAAPARVAAYSLETLGLVLGQDGRIDRVMPNAPASFAGLQPGERILAADGVALDQIKPDEARYDAPVLLRVAGLNGVTRHVLIDPWATARSIRPVGDANVLDPDVVLF